MTTHHAKGSFEVKTQPITAPDAVPGRLSLDKQFTGDLTGTGKGEMMTAMGTVKGSGAYVAIEQVSGTLHGRSGGFIL